MRVYVLLATVAWIGGMPTLASAESGAPSPPHTGSNTTVVELFTSQGCSSCPPADALLGQLAEQDNVIALSFSVDYWDYLGWKDTLASHKFTERQRAYAHSRGDGSIYTPQAVINGLTHANGSDRSQIARALEKTAKTIAATRVPIRLSEDKGKLVIETGSAPQGSTAKEATLWLAAIAKSIEVPIRRGENQGRTIIYHNVVRELIPVGMWTGSPMTVQLERQTFMRPETKSCAVLLQQGNAGPIIGAALMRHF